MSWNTPASGPQSPQVPKELLTPNISLADRIRARAENVKVIVQEIFPLQRFYTILENNYAVLESGKAVDISLYDLRVNIDQLKGMFPNTSEREIADYIKAFLVQQWLHDGMVYAWTDIHTLHSGRISCTLAQRKVISK